MIVDARVFRDEFLPADIVHRDAEMNRVTSALRPVLDGHPAENTFFFGPSGVGKTTVARFALDRLRERVMDVRTGYINCWQDYSQYKVLYRAVEELTNEVVHRHATPKDELVDILRDNLDESAILILDEVDQLEEKDVFYDFHLVPGLSLMFIANREVELFADLDSRVASRMRAGVKTRFDTYDDDELVAILTKRVEAGLVHGAATTDVLEHIARKADGDARLAIGILRIAARLGEADGRETLSCSLVDEAEENARHEIRQKSISKLNDHQRVLYEILQREERLIQKDLYQLYEAERDDSRTLRTVRNYLEKMIHYNVVDAERTTEGKVYEVVH